VKDISFVSRDAVGMQELANRLTNIMAQYEDIMVVWDIWRDLWRLLNNTIDSDCEAARNKQADEVQVLADRFRVAWWDAVGSTKGLYVHIMHEHLADMVRAVGDLRPYQSQGLEHLHNFRKLIARHLTNRQVQLTNCKYKRNRVTQSFSVQLAAKCLMREKAHDQDQKEHKRRAAANANTKLKRVHEFASTGRVKVV
jgi:hypothetical protein